MDDKRTNNKKQRSSIPINISDDLIHNRQIYDITNQVNKPEKLSNKLIDKTLFNERENKLISNMRIDRMVSNSINKLRSNETNISNIFNTNKSKINIFLSLDSRYRDRSYSFSNGIRFLLGLNQQSSKNGIIGLNFPLDQIINIELMNSVIIPVTKMPDFTYVNNIYQNEITISIDEIKFQSYLGSINNFHFCCKIENIPYGTDNNRLLAMIPYNPLYSLQQPYNLDKTLTIKFGSPDNNISFNDDNYLVYISYTNPALLTIYAYAIDNILPLNYLDNNDVICFENFKSSSDKYDSNNSNSVVYYEKFYPVTPLPTDPFTFSIPLDFTDPILVNDINKPPSDPVLDIPYTIFLFNALSNNDISLYKEGNQIANIGDIIYIYKLITNTLPPPYLKTDVLPRLYNKHGFTLTDVQPLPPGYIYNFNFNNAFNSFVYHTQSISYPTDFSVYATINNSYIVEKPVGVSIYVGSRRVRLPLRFETLQ